MSVLRTSGSPLALNNSLPAFGVAGAGGWRQILPELRLLACSSQASPTP